MSIVGIGLDATEIARIEDALRTHGERFMRRVFTAGEIEYCTRRRFAAPHFAGRWAAKEAAMKALGTGHGRGVLWKDIEVVRRGGPPLLHLHGAASQHAARLGVTRILVTITHCQTLAIAQVMLQAD